jgi:hypothetical protein
MTIFTARKILRSLVRAAPFGLLAVTSLALGQGVVHTETVHTTDGYYKAPGQSSGPMFMPRSAFGPESGTLIALPPEVNGLSMSLMDQAVPPMVAELSEGEDEATYRFKFDHLSRGFAGGQLIVRAGTAPVEVDIMVIARNVRLFVNEHEAARVSVVDQGHARWFDGYRDLLLHPGDTSYGVVVENLAWPLIHRRRDLEFKGVKVSLDDDELSGFGTKRTLLHQLDDSDPDLDDDEDADDLFPNDNWWKLELLVRLHKVTWCSMWATISGDIKLTTFGDVAYFNTFEEGVAGATGSMADSTAGEALQGILNTTNQLGDPDTMKKALAMVRAAQGNKVDEAKQRKLEEEAAAAAEKAKAQGGAATAENPISDELMRNMQGIGQGKEKFGLTLVNHKFLSDDAPKEVDDANNMETLLGAFTLEAASEGTYTPADTFIEFPLSRMAVTPGARADYGNGDKVSFSWAPGQPGFARLRIGNVTKNFITGVVTAELYTAGIYDGRRLKINVVAKFTAMRGAFSCQTAGTL